ncbi:MAG: DUF429 domain-containing protein [Alishewanella sp.]|nr:DUF429 domain-containing protein [Alishewanella sp.]MDP5037150.1 DUF429 domain-containing protein [Alishewanella sp.]MDP5187926.1 DUF429 domain-containing protein [Alishewanella sp.]
MQTTPTEHNTTYVGIDGCKSGWFVAILQGEQLRFQLCRTLAEVDARLPRHSIVFIDMPIGFIEPGEAQRQCDRLARQALPGRRGSVFPVPCRKAVYADDYPTACDINAAEIGKRFPIQTWHIVPKIRELHQLLQTLPRCNGDYYESHPELVFAGFAQAPMAELKSTAAGQQARLAVIARQVPHWLPVIEQALSETLKKHAKPDDIIDAFVLLLAASQPKHWQYLPSVADPDSEGLNRQIVYVP